jgi:carbonic anhydrase/acetyltransferase-like protein (isoleucine patch superfamily)
LRALLLPHAGRRPQLGREVFLAPTASIIGDVRLGDRASVWYGCVLRGDVHEIVVGPDTNVQDGVVMHGTLGEWPVHVGARVSIGHSASVHGCVIEDGCLIGIGARVLDGARIGAGSLVAAGAVVREGTIVPPGSLVLGLPAAVKRALSAREVEILRRTPERYRALAESARAACLAAGLPDPCSP